MGARRAAWVQPWVGRDGGGDTPRGRRAGTQASRRGNLSRLGKPQTPPSRCPDSPHGRGAGGSAGHRRSPQPPPQGCPGEQGTELPAFTHLTKPLAPGRRFPRGASRRARGERRQRVREEPPAPREGARSRRRGHRRPGWPGETPRRGGGAPQPARRGPDPAPPAGLSAAGPGNATCSSC